MLRFRRSKVDDYYVAVDVASFTFSSPPWEKAENPSPRIVEAMTIATGHERG